MSDVPQTISAAAAQADRRPTLSDLVRTAAADGATIVRSQIELAKAEMRETAQRTGKGAGLLGGAALLALTAWFLLSVGAAFGLVAAGLPVWAALLIVAVVYLLIAAVLGLLGRRELNRAKPLERTKAEVTSLVEETKSALRVPTPE
jgi:uncharacterized membrane protein YqjE